MPAEWKETDLKEYLERYFAETQEKPNVFARRARLGHATVYNALNGKSIPEPPQLRKMAMAMGISKGTLFLKAGYLDEEDLKGPVIECVDLERALEICRSIPDIEGLGRKEWLADGERIARFHRERSQLSVETQSGPPRQDYGTE